MSVETATYISQLDATLPGINDPKSEGDDHLRLIKGALKATFPNFSATPVNATAADLNVVSGASTTGASGFNVTTQSSTDNSTKAASTAMVQSAILASSGITASLPAQSGNAGKFLTTNGTAASWAVSGIGQVGSTVTANTTLTSASAGYQYVQMASLGQSITLPDATTMTVGGPRYIIDNTKGGYPCGIRDNTGTLVMAVAAGGEAYVALKDNSTAAGSWSVTGSNLEPGLITIDNTFSSTYASTVLAPFVALDNNTSIHFAALASGFAAFVVDNTGKVLTTPVTVISAAGNVPLTAFKVSNTSAIVFYGGTTVASAVVLTISGSSPSLTLAVGINQFVTATSTSLDNFIGAPGIAQLTPTLYVASCNNGGTAQIAVAVSVSGSTVTVGAAANIITTNLTPASTTVYPLTSTTALVLYKSGAAAPYTNNAVVISVSGTTCTVNTPVALTNCASSLTAAPCSTLVSATKCIVEDDNNTAGSVIAIPVTISGTTVTTGTALSVETGITTSFSYTSNSATRYNPHLWTLTTGATNTVGLWYLDTSGVSRVVVLSETSGTITAGTIVYGSISSAITNMGAGVISAQGSSEFLSLRSNVYTGASAPNPNISAVAHKISGTTITVGNTVGVAPDKISQAATSGTGPMQFISRLSSGDYVIGPTYSSAIASYYAANPTLPVFRSNGDCVNMRGAISIPLIAIISSSSLPLPVQGVSGSRAILLGSTQPGSARTSTTGYQLRLLNVEIAA